MNNKPERPDDSDCCGSGCKLCIFDVYKDRLEKWKTEKFIESNGLDQVKYSPFLITSVKNVTDSIVIYDFQAVLLKKPDPNRLFIKNAKSGIDYDVLQGFLSIKAGQYLILKGTYELNGEITAISRSYTPILNIENFSKGSFTTIISLQEKGKMSQFFKKFNVSDVVFWRGPYEEFIYRKNSYKHVILIGGGTGVVPLYNISKNIVESDDDDTWVSVLCSFRTVDTILLRKEFKHLRDYWNFRMNIFVTNQAGSDFVPNFNESVCFKKIDVDVIDNEVKRHDKDNVLIVVCGPISFNHFVKESLTNLEVKEENIFIFWYFLFFLLTCPEKLFSFYLNLVM